MDKETIDKVLSSCEFKSMPTREELIAKAKECWNELEKILARHSIPLEMSKMKYKSWRRNLIHFCPTRRANPELYDVVDDLCGRIGVKRPCVINLDPTILPLLNVSELKAAIASYLLDYSDGCDGALRMKNQAVRVVDTVEGILSKSEGKSHKEDRDVLYYISAHISYCANLLKDMTAPEIVGTDAYKSYICKKSWIYQCRDDFERYVSNDENRICRDVSNAWQAYLNKRSEIDSVSLDPSSVMQTPFMKVFQIVEKTRDLRSIATQYGWHWPTPLAAAEICSILQEIPYVVSKWEKQPALSIIDSTEYESVVKDDESAMLKSFIYSKRHNILFPNRKLLYITIEEFKESLRKIYPSYLDYYFRDELFEKSLNEIEEVAEKTPALPLSEVFNLANACAFESYIRQYDTFKSFGKVWDVNNGYPQDNDGLDSFDIFKGVPIKPSLSNWNTIRHHVRRLRRELFPLAASIYKSMEAYTASDNYKKSIWEGHLFNMSLIGYKCDNVRYLPEDDEIEVQGFLDFSKNFLNPMLQGKEPDYSRLFIHILKKQPVNFKSLKMLVKYAASCNYDQKEFESFINETRIELSDPIFVSRFHSIVYYLHTSVFEAIKYSKQLLMEDVIGPAIATNNNNK